MSKAAYEKLVREYMETAETEFKLDESDKSKHVQRGLLLLDQLIAIRPREPVWVFRKAFQLLLLRREHDALVTLEALRGVSKWPLHVHLVKTICLQRLARHGEAVEAAERALHADPDCRVSQRLKAFSLYCSGRIQEAREFATVLSFLPEGRAPLRSEQEYMALLGAEIHGFDAYMIHASGRSAQASAYFKTHRVKSSSEVVWRTMFFLEQGDFLAASQSQTTLRLLKNEKQERVISQCARIFCSFPVQTADTLYAQGLFEKIRCNSRDAITYLFRATQDAHGAPSAVAASARRALHHTALLNFCLASNHAASESPDKYPLVPWCHAVYSTLGLENLFSTLTPMPVDSPIFQTFYNETKETDDSRATFVNLVLLQHCAVNDADSIQVLLQKYNANANFQLAVGYEFPLLWAISHRNDPLVRLLVQYGADPSRNTLANADHYIVSTYSWACLKANARVLQSLLVRQDPRLLSARIVKEMAFERFHKEKATLGGANRFITVYEAIERGASARSCLHILGCASNQCACDAKSAIRMLAKRPVPIQPQAFANRTLYEQVAEYHYIKALHERLMRKPATCYRSTELDTGHDHK